MKKKKILVISGAAILAMLSFAGTSMALREPSYNHIALAEGEEVDTTVIAEEAAEKTTSKFKEIWESYLLPAVLSINVASIVSAAITIVFAIKNFKNHKDYKEQVLKLAEVVVSLSSQMLEYSMALARENEQVKELLGALKNSGAIANKQIELFEEEKSSLENLKKAIVGLVNIEVDLAKLNPEFVESGVAKQIVELKNHLLTTME